MKKTKLLLLVGLTYVGLTSYGTVQTLWADDLASQNSGADIEQFQEQGNALERRHMMQQEEQQNMQQQSQKLIPKTEQKDRFETEARQDLPQIPSLQQSIEQEYGTPPPTPSLAKPTN